VCAPGLQLDFPPLATGVAHPNNLPRQLTSLVGRQTVIEDIKNLLKEFPLVTLTGSGGVGKTRLSIRTAQEELSNFPDGVWLVELAPISDPDQVFKTVASALNLREDPVRPVQDTLVDFLRRKQALIVLDNCEHLIMACARLVDRLLLDCPQLKLLASSREALGITGEAAFRVPSLPYPEPGALPGLEQIENYPAVRLFIERTKAVLPGFKATHQNMAALARICQRLDGIPLAIELAAARMNLLTTEQLASRLDNTFSLLTGGSRTALPRQQTLRATIDWSYNLLSEKDRIVLRRFSVFAGGGSLEAVEAVCGGDGILSEEILDLLTSLANKSILQVERKQGQDARYNLLETVRQYAREKLFDAGESASLREQHLDYFLALSERAEPQLRGAGRLEWSRRLKVELDNLRSAIEWSYRQPSTSQKGLQLVTAIGFRFLTPNGYLGEASDWVLKGLELFEDQAVEPILQARAYNLLAEINENRRNYPAVLEWAQKSLQLLRESGTHASPELTWALWNYAIAMRYFHKNAQQIESAQDDSSIQVEMGTIHENAKPPIEALDESIQISRQMGSAGDWHLGMSLFVRSMFAFESLDHVSQLAQESRQAFTRSGDRWSVMMPLHQLGLIAENRNHYAEALQYCQEAATLAEESGDRPSLSYIQIHLGRIQRKMGNFLQAIHYHMDYVRLWATMGNQEALKEGFVNLGVDWFCLGNSQMEAARKDSHRKTILLISIAEKQRSMPYSFMSETDLYDQAIDTCRRECGEDEYTRVWEQGQAMTLEDAVVFAQVEPDPQVQLAK
jgi:predicted ATPase